MKKLKLKLTEKIEKYYVIDENAFDDDESIHYDLFREILHNTPKKIVIRFRDIPTILDYTKQRNRIFEYLIKKKCYVSKKPVKNSLNVFKYGTCRTWYLYSL